MGQPDPAVNRSQESVSSVSPHTTLSCPRYASADSKTNGIPLMVSLLSMTLATDSIEIASWAAPWRTILHPWVDQERTNVRQSQWAPAGLWASGLRLARQLLAPAPQGGASVQEP